MQAKPVSVHGREPTQSFNVVAHTSECARPHCGSAARGRHAARAGGNLIAERAGGWWHGLRHRRRGGTTHQAQPAATCTRLPPADTSLGIWLTELLRAKPRRLMVRVTFCTWAQIWAARAI
jgi:hypothetical protein